MPELKNWITAGNVIQIVTMLVVGVTAWANLNSRSNANEEAIRDHEARIRVIEAQVTGSLARIDQRLINIEKAVK